MHTRVLNSGLYRGLPSCMSSFLHGGKIEVEWFKARSLHVIGGGRLRLLGSSRTDWLTVSVSVRVQSSGLTSMYATTVRIASEHWGRVKVRLRPRSMAAIVLRFGESVNAEIRTVSKFYTQTLRKKLLFASCRMLVLKLKSATRRVSMNTHSRPGEFFR